MSREDWHQREQSQTAHRTVSGAALAWGSEFHESAPCRCRMVKYELDNGFPNSGASRIGFHIHLLDDSVASTAPQCLKK